MQQTCIRVFIVLAGALLPGASADAFPPLGPKDGGKRVFGPPPPEPGAFSGQHLNPPELQFSCTGTSDADEEWYAQRLAKGDSSQQLAAARALWRGRSRRYAADVLKFLAGPTAVGEAHRAFRREAEADLQPAAVLRELKEGDYLWGTWLAVLRPHKELVPALLEGLKAKPDLRPETVLALGKSRDPRALDPLLEMLKGKDYRPPGDAAQALGYLGDPKAEAALIEALASDNGWRQVHASGALAEIGTPKALPALERVANTRGYTGALNVRHAARHAVAGIERRHLPRDPARWPAGPAAEPVAALRGHTDSVWAVAFSADGRALASVGDDRAVRLWDPAAGTSTGTFSGHARQMTHVAFAPGGGMVVTAGWGGDGSVRILDVRTGKVWKSLPAADGGIGSLVVAPGGALVALSSGSGDERAVRLWDMVAGKAVATLPGTSSALAFSPDGRLLAATAGEAGEDIQLWDVAARKPTATLRGHTDGVLAAAFSPDGRTLTSGGDWTVRLWDTRNGKATAVFRGDDDIDGISFSPDGRSVAASESGGPVRVWDVSADKAIAALNARGPVAFGPDGQFLATGSADRTTLLLWEPPERSGSKE